MEMDDEEFDFKSEIGQLIVRLQKLCKKPQIDDSLSSAIKIFQEKVTRQKTYLSNGIFNINFAEAALFLQSCAELYGKKIDLLWDQLLEFHTRLIEYDFQHAKEKGKRVNQEAIDQLEERRSRYKRKKKFKLLGKENDTNLLEDFLFDDTESVEMEPCKMDIDCFKSWKSLEHESAVLTKIPKSVYKQQLLKYRMKNYNILKSEDFDLYDPNGEFNTKYSRIPGWHVIEHLFDYNTKGLLPDKNNTIAKLRLSCYLRAQFMRDNNIPFNAPYSEYKDQYLKFREKFFEKEANKWQNMPLQTLLDFSKQLDYLAKMEKENEEKKEKHEPGFEAIPFIPKLTCNIPNCLDCLDSKSSIITISDSLEADLGDIKDLSKNELVVNLEKLPEDVVKKLRMDSGYFECEEKDEELFSFENDIVNSSGNAEDKVTNNMEQIDKTTEKEILNDSVLMQVEGNSEKIISPTTENTVAITESVLSEKNDDNGSNVNINANTANENVTTENIEEEDNNEDTRSVFSDHDYCVLPKPGNVGEEDDDTRSILSDHDYCVQPNQGNVLKENNTISKENKNMVPLKLASKVVLRVNKIRLAKENRPKIENMGPPPPPKRKKFSNKQVEKLMKSKIVPVNEIKFEKFFSLNYQPQMGEGEVQEVNYESEDEINQEPKETLSGKTVRAIETDDENDDVCSIRSDHSYCQLPEESASNSRTLSHTLTTNDSGFFESVLPSLDRSEEHLNASIGMENVEEYDNNLDEIRDDIERRDDCEEITSLEDLLDAERQKQQETERLESKIRVEEWRQTITPILNNLKEKDFDIHEYGGKIMEGMQIGETKPFKNIVDGKSSAEVVRHFIASLQLANTYNVEICGAKSGELSNDTLSIKLLNIDRYHEHLTDYNAPSEETFRDRLKNVMKESRNLKQIADTKEPKFKRLRLNKTPIKRKLVSSDSDDDDYETASCSTTPVHSLKHRFKRSSNIRANATITDILQSEDIEVDSSLSDTLSPTIEHFESELTKSQQLNPDMQKFSTPLSVQLTRTVDPVLLRQRSLFS